MVERVHLDEIWRVIDTYIPRDHAEEFIVALKATTAYQANKSCRDTINALEMHRQFPEPPNE